MIDPTHDVTEIGAKLGLPATALRPYGRDKAKIEVAALGPVIASHGGPAILGLCWHNPV